MSSCIILHQEPRSKKLERKQKQFKRKTDQSQQQPENKKCVFWISFIFKIIKRLMALSIFSSFFFTCLWLRCAQHLATDVSQGGCTHFIFAWLVNLLLLLLLGKIVCVRERCVNLRITKQQNTNRILEENMKENQKPSNSGWVSYFLNAVSKHERTISSVS